MSDVRIYGKEGCAACENTGRRMTSLGIAHTHHDLENRAEGVDDQLKQADAMAAVQIREGRLPVVMVDGEIVGEKELDYWMEAMAESITG